MIGPISAAASALAAESKKLQVSAHNTANVNTEGFVPQQVVQTEGPGGGVIAEIVPPSPDEPPPRVDLANEAVDRITATRAYEANLAVMKSALERVDALFEAVG
jgi:flagellar basal body rod protein FlgC